MLLLLAAAAPFVSSVVLPATVGGHPAPVGTAAVQFFALLTAAIALLSRSAIRSLRPLGIPLAAVTGLGLLGLFQLLPLPEGVLQRIASVNLQIYHETAQLLSLFGRSADLLPRVSIAPGGTVRALLDLSAACALFLAAAGLLRSRSRRRLFFGVLLAAGIAGALAVGIGRPFENPAEPVARPLTAWFGILLCGAFGVLWAEVLTNSDRAQDSEDRSERFERRFGPIAGRALVWLAIATGLALCRSWAAVVTAAVTTLLMISLALRRRSGDRVRRLGAAAAIAVGGLLIAGRLAAQTAPPAPGLSQTSLLWRTALDAWRDFPIVGAGLGSFAEAFRRVQTRELAGLVDIAPSSPLHILVTGGVVGLLLAATALLSLLVLLYRAWRSQPHREESALALGAFGALAFWLLDGLLEFNALPAFVPATLAAVLGAGWAASQARGSQVTP
jgi:hypothetical protein